MLALVAGQGRLPGLVATSVRDAGRDVTICALDGFVPDAGIVPDRVFRLEQLGTLLSDLRAQGVRSVCFAGAVKRPVLDPALVDAQTRPMMERLVSAMRHGDDGALRTILGFFEDYGMTIRSAHELVPELLPPEGVPTQTRPLDSDGPDAAKAERIVAALGQLDVGQACVVAHGLALAVEALPGTDAMLASLAQRPPGLPEGGIFYKGPKPQQDRRVDLPTIGPATVRACAHAGLRGLVIEAGGVMILDRAEVIAEADAHGLFLWVRRAGQDCGPVP